MSSGIPIGPAYAEATLPEQVLLSMNEGYHDLAISYASAKLKDGRSPSFLSVLRPDLLEGFAHAWKNLENLPATGLDGTDGYKHEYFARHALLAAQGDPASIETLPKLATTIGQLSLAMELVLDNKDAITEWHSNRSYLQYLGTFDPQHIGHRIAVQSTLNTAGGSSSALVHVMGRHPRKPQFHSPYEQRYEDSEERFIKTTLLDTTRVTQVDIPGGVGLASRGLGQMKLLADSAGDPELRWTIGSDKLMLDAAAVRAERATDKSIERLLEPRMHMYAVRRQTDDPSKLVEDADYLRDRFDTTITLVEELPYDCAPASSTLVRQLRSNGMPAEADHMEYYELPR